MIPFVFQWLSTLLNKQIIKHPSLLSPLLTKGTGEAKGTWKLPDQMKPMVCSDQYPVLDKTYITSFRAKFSSSKNREKIAEEEVSF